MSRNGAVQAETVQAVAVQAVAVQAEAVHPGASRIQSRSLNLLIRKLLTDCNLKLTKVLCVLLLMDCCWQMMTVCCFAAIKSAEKFRRFWQS